MASADRQALPGCLGLPWLAATTRHAGLHPRCCHRYRMWLRLRLWRRHRCWPPPPMLAPPQPSPPPPSL